MVAALLQKTRVIHRRYYILGRIEMLREPVPSTGSSPPSTAVENVELCD